MKRNKTVTVIEETKKPGEEKKMLVFIVKFDYLGTAKKVFIK